LDNSSTSNEAHILNCTFETQYAVKFCKIENADLTNDTRDSEFTFVGPEVKKRNTNGVIFFKCFDVDFIPTEIFKEFPSINNLAVTRSYIPVLRNDLFTIEFTKIRHLYLAFNQIKTIQSDAFENLRSLRNVYLSSNEIEVMKSNIFKENSKLEKIYLDYNKIKMLNTNLFHDLKYLAVLGFKENECAGSGNAYELKNLERELLTCYEKCKSDEECKQRSAEELENHKEIKSIFCNYDQINWKNRRSCLIDNTELRANIIYEIGNIDDEASEIRVVYFHSSSVVEIIPEEIIKIFTNMDSIGFHETKIPILKAGFFTNSFKTIEEVLLKENGIQQIEDEAFLELQQLREIDLSLNKIKSINKELFAHNPNLRIINLSENKIFMIQQDSFKQQVKLEELILAGNNCSDTNFGSGLAGRSKVSRINNRLKKCYSKYLEQEKKLNECKFFDYKLFLVLLEDYLGANSWAPVQAP
jgi:Leucine-rich repeat (LRR) protein